MIIKKEIFTRLNEFKAICENHNVKFMFAYGSSTTDSFDQKSSDIDLLVQIDEPDPLARGEKLISLWDSLEALFQRKIDLLTETSIKNPILKKNIEDTKVLIYDGTAQKILNL